MNNIEDWLSGFYELNPDAVEEEEVITKKEPILPLHQELTSMDFRKFDFYKTLTPEQKKEMSPWVLMRWMSSTARMTEHHLLTVNDLVNVNFNALQKHPELQWKLLALCGTGSTQRHEWIPPGKGVKKNRIEQALLDIFPLMKDDELEMVQEINTKEELVQFFKDNGFDDKTIKEMFKGK